ncbi:MAG: hypothetical protein WD512_08630, partial [Candidatus Paceibacterota bacterium]
EVFNLYKDRNSVQISVQANSNSGPAPAPAPAPAPTPIPTPTPIPAPGYVYQNESLVIKSNEYCHNSSFYINFLVEKDAEYLIELETSLKNTSLNAAALAKLAPTPSLLNNSLRVASKQGNEKEFVKAQVLIEARKPSKKLIDHEIVLQTGINKPIDILKLTIPFVALTDRAMIGMIVSEGPFELVVNSLNVRKLQLLSGIEIKNPVNNSLGSKDIDHPNDTLSHIASTESIVHNVRSTTNIDLLKPRIVNNSDNKGSWLEDTDESSNTTLDSDDSDSEDIPLAKSRASHNKNHKNGTISMSVTGSDEESDNFRSKNGLYKPKNQKREKTETVNANYDMRRDPKGNFLSYEKNPEEVSEI